MEPRAHNNLRRIQSSSIYTFTLLFSLLSLFLGFLLCFHPAVRLSYPSIVPFREHTFPFFTSFVSQSYALHRRGGFLFSIWLPCVSPLSAVFSINWPGGLADPERDEGAEWLKKPGLWTCHALLLAYTDTSMHKNTDSCAPAYIHIHTPALHQSEMCGDIWKLTSVR